MSNNRGPSLIELGANLMVMLPPVVGITLHINGGMLPGETLGLAWMSGLASVFTALFVLLITAPLRGRNREDAEAAFSAPAFLLATGLVAAVMTAGAVVAKSGGVTIAEASVILAAGITAAGVGYAIFAVAGRRYTAR